MSFKWIRQKTWPNKTYIIVVSGTPFLAVLILHNEYIRPEKRTGTSSCVLFVNIFINDITIPSFENKLYKIKK